MYIDKVDVDESPSYSYSPLALAKCFGFVLFEKYELVGEVFWVREFLLLVWVACLLSRSHTNVPYCLDLAADAGLGPFTWSVVVRVDGQRWYLCTYVHYLLP